MHGLFFLSKDLFDDHFQRVTNPDAREILIIRNHLAHKYLQLHEMLVSEPANEPLCISLSERDFAAKALQLLKMVRAALIYLPLAIHREEVLREKRRTPGLVGEMSLRSYDDGRKRR